MEGQYHRWISAAFKDYGKDPWIFLRELAQNSRDAHARLIKVETGVDREGHEIIVFKDDGIGMTYQQARQYLFRLYSSSKDKDNLAAGMYGIGFWTVLRFKPVQVVIESCHKNENWAVTINEDLESQPSRSSLTAPGTKITLRRPPKFDNVADFKRTVKHHLSRYCRFLRRSDRRGTPLPIILDGKAVNRPFTLPGQLIHHFRKGSLEGVIGLGEKPQVILYACGLPVWEGSTLAELSHSVKDQGKKRNYEIGPGLAPVFLLNGNRLAVNFSRRSVLDNRELKKVKKTAERELANLVQLYTSAAVPQRRGDALVDGFKRAGRGIRRSWWKKILLMIILVVPLEIGILHWFFGEAHNSANPILRVTNQLYNGATVSNGNDAPGLDLTYFPGNRALHFKIFSADSYNMGSGFIRGLHQNLYKSPDEPSPGGDKLNVQLNTREAGKIFLPIPFGYKIKASSIQLNGSPLPGARQSPAGEITVVIPENGGSIRYECYNIQRRDSLNPSQTLNYTSLPAAVKLPGSIQKELPSLERLNTFQKVRSVLDLIGKFVSYDASAATAAQYKKTADSGDWLNQVLTIGQGDCDILNGLNVLLLRKAGVPSRLAVGFIGNNGAISSVAHAWTEYFHNGWHTIDASGVIPLRPPSRPGESSTNIQSLPTGWIGLILLLLVGLYIVWVGKKRPPRSYGGETEKIRENLARLAIGAMLYPTMWGLDSNLWDKRIIPTTTNRYISLRRVLRLSRRNKLFAGHPKNPVVKRVGKSRFPILDIGNSAFRKLIHLLPGVVNLDAIHRLRVKHSRDMTGQTGAALIDTFNSRTEEILPQAPLLMWAPGLPEGSEDFQVVDLEPLFNRPTGDECPWHRKVVAINPSSGAIGQLDTLFSNNPPLALFRLMEAVLRITQESPATQEKYLEKFSAHLLQTIAPEAHA